MKVIPNSDVAVEAVGEKDDPFAKDYSGINFVKTEAAILIHLRRCHETLRRKYVKNIINRHDRSVYRSSVCRYTALSCPKLIQRMSLS